MVGLKDIASACGVSLTQVSRALNSHGDVSQKTRKLVLKTAKELGYVKNINAQNLANGKAKQIALIINGITEDENLFNTNMLQQLLKGASKFAETVDYEVVLHVLPNEDISLINHFKQRNIHGIVIFGVKYDAENFKELMESDFACVAIDIPIKGKNKGSVIVNNNYYSMIAVQELINKGKKNIAMISGHEHAIVTLERSSGYRAAHALNNVEINEEIIVQADFDYQLAYEKTAELFIKHKEIDAIFCHSDIMALGACKALEEMNIDPKNEILLCGFDGITLRDVMFPYISTIKQNHVDKGYEASKLLYNILNKPTNTIDNTIFVPCDYIEGTN